MTPLLPELADLSAEAILDGEIVAFADGLPHFPLLPLSATSRPVSARAPAKAAVTE
jgi:ATP-dependent DNA ligase